jgi:hypothetical protein
MGYVSSTTGGVRYKNEVRKAIAEDFPAAFYSGYVDAGGEETEDDDETWLTARVREELDYIDGVFAWLREQRDNETATEDAITARVEKWLGGVNSAYTEGKLRGAKNVMLTFGGEDGEESCKECQKYKGQRHSARWWLAHDLIRRNGNENFSCGRWEDCHHDLYTDKGELYTR